MGRYQKRIWFWMLCRCILPMAPGIFADAGGAFYGFQWPDLGLSNCLLYCHHSGVYAYSQNSTGLRLGWHTYGVLSSIDPGENVYGSLSAGVLVGQEFKYGPLFLAATALAGLGLSASNLGDYPGHLLLLGEVQGELGFYLSEWLQFGVSLGLQGFGSLLPGIPFSQYGYYTPALGFKITWQSEFIAD